MIGLKVPQTFIEEKCRLYMRNGKPVHRTELINDDEFTIVKRYQDEYRGYVQYYLLAFNVCRLAKLRWVMEASLLKTLAHKQKVTVMQIVKKYKTRIRAPNTTDVFA